MRPSEVIALNREDIDWIRGVILIIKALTEALSEPEITKSC